MTSALYWNKSHFFLFEHLVCTRGTAALETPAVDAALLHDGCHLVTALTTFITHTRTNKAALSQEIWSKVRSWLRTILVLKLMEIRLPQRPGWDLWWITSNTHTVTDSRALTNTSPLNPPTITLHSLSFDHNTAQPCVYYTPTLLFYGKHILLLGGYSMLSLQVEEIHCNKAEKNEIHHTKLKQISKLDTRQVT